MTTHARRTRGVKRWMMVVKVSAALGVGAMALAACGHLKMMGRDIDTPPTSEFGFGPRASTGGLYEATLEPAEPLRTRRLQTVKLSVRRSGEAPVEHASIIVDGGMPQHGHGLPTRPRVTRELGAGVYQVEGVKFNMGGWWELKFRIDSEAGTDSVTFNLDL